MKSLFKCLALLGVLLLTAPSTVKADEIVKPDTAAHTTPVKIYRLSDGLWNYSEAALCAAAHSAIPSLTFIARKWENPNPGEYWLRFWVHDLSTGGYGNVYFHVELNGGWLEMPYLGGGWPAPRCGGDCLPLNPEWVDPFEPAICSNKGTIAMVNCACSGNNGGGDTDYTRCWFIQYPTSTVESFFNIVKAIPPLVE